MLNEKTKYMTKEGGVFLGNPEQIKKGEFATFKLTNEPKDTLAKIHELASRPAKCSLDEVAHAYFAALRVGNWEDLSSEFGGYKIGAIYAFILGLIEQHIADTLDAREMAKEALFQNHISEGKQ